MIVFKQQCNNKYRKENENLLGTQHPEVTTVGALTAASTELAQAHTTSVRRARQSCLSSPQGPGFPESGRNCPQQGGARGPSS